jgi:hypothetical protein
MKQYYLDKRVLVNGKTSHIELSNFINLYTYISSIATTVATTVATTISDAKTAMIFDDGTVLSTLEVTATQTTLEFDNGTTSASLVAIDDAGTGDAGILLTGIPAFDDDAAAGVAGLLAGAMFQTTGLGAAPLDAAGILMIKQ